MKELEMIARDDYTADQAREFLYSKEGRDLYPAGIYNAFLRWTWIAMNTRRFDDELRKWHRLILDVAASHISGPSAGDLGQKVKALADLVKMSVQASDPARFDSLSSASQKILDFVRTRDGYIPRTEIRESLEIPAGLFQNTLNRLVRQGNLVRDPHSSEPRYKICT